MVSGEEPVTVREASALSGLPKAFLPFLVMVQAFTLVAFQETVVVGLLGGTREGVAWMETVGCRTVTVTVLELAEPPGPVQVI